MIKFNCQFCGSAMYAEDTAAGVLVTCPNSECAQTIEVPVCNSDLSGNPFYRQIATLYQSLWQIAFTAPYLPQLIQIVITCVILAVLCVLFATVGIAAQIGAMFQRLIHETGISMQRAQSAERTGYAVAIGIYRLLFFPFWLIQVPIRIVARLLEHPSSATFIILLAAAAIYLRGYYPALWEHFLTTCREVFAR